MGIFNSNTLCSCSKHNYTGLNNDCPDCISEASKPEDSEIELLKKRVDALEKQVKSLQGFASLHRKLK